MKSELLDINDLADEVAVELLHPSAERLRALLPDASEDTLKQVRTSLEDLAYAVASARMDAEPPKRRTASEDDLNKLDALFRLKAKGQYLTGDRVTLNSDGVNGYVVASHVVPGFEGTYDVAWDDGHTDFEVDESEIRLAISDGGEC